MERRKIRRSLSTTDADRNALDYARNLWANTLSVRLEGEGGAGGGGGGAGEGGAGGDGSGSGGDDKTFTQADIDRIVQDRLARERQRYADYDDLKTKAAQFDELESEKKTEIERATEKATTAETRASTLENENRRLRVENAVLAEAPSKEIRDPRAAFKLLDLDQVDYGDDGQPTNLDTLLDALAEEYPILKATPNGNGGDGGNNGGGKPKGEAGQGAGGGNNEPSPDEKRREIVDSQKERVKGRFGVE